MILGTKESNTNRMRLKKALFLESVEDEGHITSSHSCELLVFLFLPFFITSSLILSSL